MGSQGKTGDLFRHQLRDERLRRGWSQTQLANTIAARSNVYMYASTIAKIENGHRAVRPDELAAFADLFGMSTDILLGRSGSASDVLWAASKLSSNAQKMIGEVEHLQSRLLNDLQDLNVCITRDKHPMIHMHDTAHRASLALQGAADALAAVAGEFPIPGGIA